MFRVDGDGWYDYYGRPTDAPAPFRFTAEGTEIDQLVHGKLGVTRVVPWDDVPPGYGRHRVEYRAIDATGNVGTLRPVRAGVRGCDMDVSFADMFLRRRWP